MIEIKLFSVITDESIDTCINKSKLFLNQEMTSIELNGEQLEYQFKLDEQYLLILSTLVSWGEAVYFYLLDSDIKIIDELAISGDMFDSPFLSNLTIVGENEIEFSYYNENDRWLLAVYNKKKVVLPNLNPFSMVFRPKLSKQIFSHFDLTQLR